MNSTTRLQLSAVSPEPALSVNFIRAFALFFESISLKSFTTRDHLFSTSTSASVTMKLSEKIASYNSSHPFYTFEFFPPRTDQVWPLCLLYELTYSDHNRDSRI